MRALIQKRIRWWLAVAGVVALAASVGMPLLLAAAQTVPPESGIVCTTSNSPNASFTLTARDGYVSIPDGNTIYMWSYAIGSNPFQLPGPTLCVNQGDTVTIVLNNLLPEPASIMFPGQENVLANGSPAQPEFSGPVLTSLTNSAPVSGTVTYSFVASTPGTYLYESGTDPGKQVQMGLYGALVVRPAGHADWAYAETDGSGQPLTRFNPAAEYVMLFAEVDPDLHAAVELGDPYDVTTLHPRYWMINGRSFPDTIAPNNSDALPAQPYSSMVHIQPTSSSNLWPALVRYLNVGGLNHPFHPHGNHGRIIARDGQLLIGPAGEDASYEKFLVLVGSGQTWDATYTWTDVDGWTPTTNPIPVTLPEPQPQQQNLVFKGDATWYSGSPYLGVKDELPVGTTSYNECGEYYHVWHSHALNEAANYEAGFGGMFTLERVDPPGGCP